MYYYAHHIGDFTKDTENLNDHQLATYLRMLWSYYTNESPITGEFDDIAFAMRSDKKTVRLLLRHYFTKTNVGWTHTRCDKEISAYHDKSEKSKASANARWSNANAMRTHRKSMRTQCERIANTMMRTHSEQDANASKIDANAMRTHSEHDSTRIDKSKKVKSNANAMRTHNENDANATKIDANQEPIININTYVDKSTKVLVKESIEWETSFEEFWETYDYKKDKSEAFRAWKKIKPTGELLQTILAQADLYAQTRKPEYIAHASTWLNKKRWQDEITSSTKNLKSDIWAGGV
jgi:uncharacterized protein YdaU (DUF1376 family)